jgi:hypothetical protein
LYHVLIFDTLICCALAIPFITDINSPSSSLYSLPSVFPREGNLVNGSIKFTPHGIISLSISFVIAKGLLDEAFPVSFRSRWGRLSINTRAETISTEKAA